MQGFPSEVVRSISINLIGLTIEELDGLEIALSKGQEAGNLPTDDGSKKLLNSRQDGAVSNFRTIIATARKKMTDDETAPKAMTGRAR